ncbi:major facilitator superfamily transporter [Saccharata proteae CBS 121410]|uniref:Major facilitator superfamily transporter n=1 Tax=Saccharata proteae CBS 121410 TaxID=1314787 RepID=A0A9P4M0Z1_9PEZI|nr:major facilitator superfamily transporter [Saccharata proteae CBS 121410]
MDQPIEVNQPVQTKARGAASHQNLQRERVDGIRIPFCASGQGGDAVERRERRKGGASVAESVELHPPSEYDGEPITRRVSALEEAPSLAPPAGFPGFTAGTRRRSNVSQTSKVTFQEDVQHEDVVSLTRSASAISGHNEARRESQDELPHLPHIARPRAAKPGPYNTIREVPSELNTPLSTRPPSPVSGFSTRPSSPASSGHRSLSELDVDERAAQNYPDVGTIKSWRGALILVATCGAQLMDNIFMTSVNISLPSIQKEFTVDSANLQWLISAYTLTFGGFLLLAGVLSDRYGRKHIFCGGMLTLSVWSVANGFAGSFIQLAIFRALQGVGAAMTVPSAVGIISNYFISQDRTLALSVFGAAGAVGFCLGLIFGGFLTGSLGWRYVFYLSTAVTGILGITGWIVLPKDRVDKTRRPKLDFLGAGLSTGGLILLSFVLSSGGQYGWGKAFIIVLLILSIAMLGVFTLVEKKVSNPVMPLQMWKFQNFAGLWISGFVMYGAYQTVVYYTTLIAQDIDKLSASQTALRFLPMGATGFIFSLGMSHAVEKFNTKHLLLFGMTVCTIAPIPAALIRTNSINFWLHIFPTSVLGVAGTTIVYICITVSMLASVPVNVKSLCGGMINTAFQIGSGVGLALASAVVQAVDTNKGHGLLDQYGTGLWCCCGLAGIGVVASAIGVKSVKPGTGGGEMMLH